MSFSLWKVMRRGGAYLFVATTVLAGCSTDRDPWEFFAPSDVGTVVVQAVLTVDEWLPAVYVSRAQAPGTTFSFQGSRETGAVVEVYDPLYGWIRYDAWDNGVYVPITRVRIRPETTYRLRITTAAGEVITAMTTTPARYKINEWVLLDSEGVSVTRRLRTFDELGDSVYYAPENQIVYAEGILEARFAPVAVPAYQFSVLSLDLNSDLVVDPDFIDEADLGDARRGASPPFEAPNGRARLPWFAIFFEERYKVKGFAVDRNWYDLIRSTPDEDQGAFSFGGSPGGNFERPIFHINGGIGLFGSASVDSIGFFVRPRP